MQSGDDARLDRDVAQQIAAHYRGSADCGRVDGAIGAPPAACARKEENEGEESDNNDRRDDRRDAWQAWRRDPAIHRGRVFNHGRNA